MSFPGGSAVKNSPAIAEDSRDKGSIPGWERSQKKLETHSSILACRIPWTEDPGGQSMGSWRVGHDWACTHVRMNPFKGPYSKCSHDLKSWRSRLQHMNVVGYRSARSTPPPPPPAPSHCKVNRYRAEHILETHTFTTGKLNLRWQW